MVVAAAHKAVQWIVVTVCNRNSVAMWMIGVTGVFQIVDDAVIALSGVVLAVGTLQAGRGAWKACSCHGNDNFIMTVSLMRLSVSVPGCAGLHGIKDGACQGCGAQNL